jgi:DNA-binding transcriptional regulator PaaX
MEGRPSRLESLLKFLAEWETTRRTVLVRILTAGQLADIRELERIYGLSPSRAREQRSVAISFKVASGVDRESQTEYRLMAPPRIPSISPI